MSPKFSHFHTVLTTSRTHFDGRYTQGTLARRMTHARVRKAEQNRGYHGARVCPVHSTRSQNSVKIVEFGDIVLGHPRSDFYNQAFKCSLEIYVK